MNTDQMEKAIQLCRDLQTHALNEIVKGVKSGERLSTKDLRLIEDIRKQLEAQRTFAKGDQDWITLADAAKRLGINVRTLQLWCSGNDALHQPPLPHKREGRTILLPIQAAHAHLTQHAKRLALNPLDLSTESESEDSEEVEPGNLITRLESSLSRMHRRLVETPHGLRLYSQTLKILEETKIRREAMERNITTDDAINMLRSLGEVYCETIQSNADACAADLLSVIHRNADYWKSKVEESSTMEPLDADGKIRPGARIFHQQTPRIYLHHQCNEFFLEALADDAKNAKELKPGWNPLNGPNDWFDTAAESRCLFDIWKWERRKAAQQSQQRRYLEAPKERAMIHNPLYS